jgi:mono/diheme cytochrome c family protein
VQVKTVLVLAVLAAALLAAGVGALVVASGAYDVSARREHTAPVYRLVETTMRRSVQTRAARLEAPADLRSDARRTVGAACYRALCLRCHGGPGVAPEPWTPGLQPLPGPLIDAARRWRPAEIYWITRHGIKMSGMPAWDFRLDDDALWSVAAFVEHLAVLTPAAFRASLAAADPAACPPHPGARIASADAKTQARIVLRQYACVGCHTIPGVVGADVHVGPPLAGFGRRSLIAGRLPNSADNLVRWIVEPASVDPQTAMPAMGVAPEHARQIADYLLELH